MALATIGFALFLGLDVFLEVLQNRLPTLLLQFDRILRFAFKRLNDARFFALFCEDNRDRPPAFDHVVDLFVRRDLRIRAVEVEREAAVFRCHNVRKRSADAQIIRGFRTAPFV